MKGAPVGLKAEGKRSVRDIGNIVVFIRDKERKVASSPPSPAPAAPVAAAGAGLTITLEDGSVLGTVACAASETLAAIRVRIGPTLDGPMRGGEESRDLR